MTVEEALAKVRDDLGAEARIVSADRVRSGGLAGFFAREHFELKVEVDDEAVGEGREPAAGQSAMEPADRWAEGLSASATSILDLVDRVSEQERSVATSNERPSQRPSTEEPAFAAVMRRIAGEAGLLDRAGNPVLPDDRPAPVKPPAGGESAPPDPSRWTPLHVGAPAARPTVETTPLLPEPEAEPERGPEPQPEPERPAAEAAPRALDDGAEGLPWEPELGMALAIPDTVPVAWLGAGLDDEPQSQAEPEPAPEAEPAAGATPGGDADLTDRTDLTPEQVPRAVADTGAEVPATALVLAGADTSADPATDTAADPAADTESDRLPATRIPNALERLGLPGAMLPTHATIDDLVPALLRELRRLPAVPALPSAPGSITCVAGPRDEAVELARTVSEELGLDPDDVVVASRQGGRRRTGNESITSAAAATERAREWRAFATSKVVVLPLDPGSRDTTWARRVIEALGPEAVWASVDARRKCEDIEAWCAGIGGIDALSLGHVDETVSPAAVLHLGVPVALLDARWASAALWALLLAERVTTAPVAA